MTKNRQRDGLYILNKAKDAWDILEDIGGAIRDAAPEVDMSKARNYQDELFGVLGEIRQRACILRDEE